MTAARDGEASPRQQAALDAEFEIVPHARAAIQPAAAVVLKPVPDIGMATLRPQRLRAFAQRGTPLFWLGGLALVAASFWVSGGHAVMRSTEGFAGTALRISGVTSRVEQTSVKAMLFVDGEAVNDGEQAAELPALAIEVAMQDGAVLHYRLGTAGRRLGPAERFGFSSRLDVPKNGVKTVSVAFAG